MAAPGRMSITKKNQMNTQTFQEKQVLDLLSSPNPNGFTRMQIANCLGIDRASVCYRIHDLRKRGVIWVVKKGFCPITGNRSEFLTSNRQVAMSLPASARSYTEKPEQTGKLF